MIRARIIPCLLLDGGGLVKTVKFKSPAYIGDPINAVKIFNEKEVDELIFLDISATRKGLQPNFSLLEDIASEAFMPFSYGGGISKLEEIKRLYSLGIEKIILNTSAIDNPRLISEAASAAGSSGVVVSMDVKRTWTNKAVVVRAANGKVLKIHPVAFATEMESLGAGELMVNSIDRDGTMTGYDLEILQEISASVSIPVVAAGGAGSLDDLRSAIDCGASAAAAGSLFVFHGKHKAVLITYPKYEELEDLMAYPPGKKQ